MSKIKIRFDGKIYDDGLARVALRINPLLFTKIKIMKFYKGKEYDDFLEKALERIVKEEEDKGFFEQFDFSELIWQKNNHLSDKSNDNVDLKK